MKWQGIKEINPNGGGWNMAVGWMRLMGVAPRALGMAICCLGSLWVLHGCDYARMKEQESVRTYETKLPRMPGGTVPVDGGLERLLASNLKQLSNPLGPDPTWLRRGEEAYGFYCSMCHGPRADGMGTVGQSFEPLPADLSSPQVQSLTDGELFGIISLGSKRSPPLASTIAEDDRWAIVLYVRSLENK